MREELIVPTDALRDCGCSAEWRSAGLDLKVTLEFCCSQAFTSKGWNSKEPAGQSSTRIDQGTQSRLAVFVLFKLSELHVIS